MADTSGMADLRGLDVDKLVKGFADENIILKDFVAKSPTSAREIRWYQKSAGFVAPATTTTITSNLIDNTDFGALPVVAEQSWTRNSSYVKKFFVESPMITMEDVKDSDVDILATNIRDLVRAVQRRVEKRIYDVLTENDTPVTIQEVAITHEWDDTTNAIPISDLLTAKEYLKNYNYNSEGAVLVLRPDAERWLMNYLISIKGSSIPMYSSDKIKSGQIMEVLGIKLYTSTIVTSNNAVMFVPQIAATWKSFADMTSAQVKDEGIGVKIRVWEEGECLLTDPKAVVYFSNIGPS